MEAPLLRPLPGDVFPAALTLTPRVDRYARITVRQAQYSVPARLIGRRVRAQLGAAELVVFDGRVEVARHERSTVKGSQTLVLDHYLEVLARKPGALPGATALAQARAAGTFTAAHEAFWAAARTAHGDVGGTRALVEVLLLHRHLDSGDVVTGLTAALSVGSSSADVVAVEARKAVVAHRAAGGPMTAAAAAASTSGERVVSLTERRLLEPRAEGRGGERQLPVDARPLPSVAHYDELLTRRPTTSAAPAETPGVATGTGGTP